jgi:hypothetical protein
MKWEVDITEDFTSGSIGMRAFYQESPGRYIVLVPMISEGRVTWGKVTVDEGESVPFTMEFSRVAARGGLLDAMADALARYGAKPKADVNEATVGAMKNHLSDLESLLFGSDKVQILREGAAKDASV